MTRIQNTISEKPEARRIWRRHPVAFATVGALTFGSLGLVSLSTASAATSANLSVSQAFSGSTTSGSTIDTVTIHNAGTGTATNINLTELLKTTSSTFAIHSNAGTCEIGPAPAGYQIMGDCQFASLASGSSITETITWSGTAGTAFTSTMLVGSSSSDPSQANNASSKTSYFGPRADLAVSQKATVGTTGKATIVATTKNNGPNTADALQMITEISTPITGVTVSSNLSSSCQFIPPASGFTSAVSCVTDSLASAKSWTLTYAFGGAAGATLTEKNTVSANTPADPVTSNNSNTITTHYGS